jgi:hypothetical protein
MTTAVVARLQANRTIYFINEQKSIKTGHPCNFISK